MRSRYENVIVAFDAQGQPCPDFMAVSHALVRRFVFRVHGPTNRRRQRRNFLIHETECEFLREMNRISPCHIDTTLGGFVITRPLESEEALQGFTEITTSSRFLDGIEILPRDRVWVESTPLRSGPSPIFQAFADAQQVLRKHDVKHWK